MARWKESFTSVVYTDNAYLPDEYTVEVFFYPAEGVTLQNQTVAFERIKFFLMRCCQNSVMINHTYQDEIAHLHKNTSSKLMVLPAGGDLAEIFFSKITEITNETLNILHCNVTSWQGDQIEISYDIDDEFSDSVLNFYSEESITPWYFDNTPRTNNLVLAARHKPLYYTSWKPLGLTYNTPKSSNKNLSLAAKPAIIRSWTPRVIDGGKSEL